MKYSLRIADRLLEAIHADLSRRHAFAYERVGHLHCRVGVDAEHTVILAEEYHAVADRDYLPSDELGAMIGPAAIRSALQRAYGAVGGRPQVVWPNGVLASTAVGAFVQLIAPWSEDSPALYTEYDGNRHRLFPSHRLGALAEHACPHYPAAGGLGDIDWSSRTEAA